MPHIGIDCRFAQSHSGLGRYTREIVSHILRLGGGQRFTLFVRSRTEEWLSGLQGSFDLLEADIPHYSFEEQYRLPVLLRSAGLDTYFSPHFNVPMFCPVPFVATIHDLILHRYPNQAPFAKRCAYRVLMQRTVRRARHIIAVSRFTAREIESVYGKGTAANTSVIYEGINGRFHLEPPEHVLGVRSRHALSSPFFLYVGNAKQHKNVQMLIDAFLQAHPAGHELVLVTGGPEASRLRTGPGVRILHGFPEEDLPSLYSACRAFVTASRYEGFCFPVLEAAACGCPVIAADSSAIAEVAPEDAVLLPVSVDYFAAAFLAPPERPRAGFTPPQWEQAAEATLSVLVQHAA